MTKRKPFTDDETATNGGSGNPEKTIPDFTLSGIQNLEADFNLTFGEIIKSQAAYEPKSDLPTPEPLYAEEATRVGAAAVHNDSDSGKDDAYREEAFKEESFKREAEHSFQQTAESSDIEEDHKTQLTDKDEPRGPVKVQEEAGRVFDEATRVMPTMAIPKQRVGEDTAKTDDVDRETRTPFVIKSQHSNPAIEVPDLQPNPRSWRPRVLLIAGVIALLGALSMLLPLSNSTTSDSPATAHHEPSPPAPPPRAAEVRVEPPPRETSQVETLLYQFHAAFHKTHTQVHRKTGP